MIRTLNFNTVKFLIVIILLCSTYPIYADTFIRDDLILDPTPSRFNICHGGTCENISYASLDEQQWQVVKDIFKNNKTAKKERQNIRLAIAEMEKMVGKITNTYNDKAKNISDKQLNHYMDCIDESTNTTLYMRMMKKEALLKWHTVEDRENRGFFFNGWPHTTAVIKDKQTGDQYAVDSWFLENGKKPFVVPLQQWLDGWRADE